MLLSQEQYAYKIAVSAATGTAFNQDSEVCPLCKGCGLLPHPTSYMGVAQCYLCTGGLVTKKKEPAFDRREICNASSKAISA